MGRRLQGVVVLGLLWPLAAGCLDPTQIVVEVTTDVDCASVGAPETGLTFGDPAVAEGPDHNTVTYECRVKDGPDYIGRITAVPSGDDDRASIAIRVVTAIGAGLDQCAHPDYDGPCIVARRQLRFLPQKPLTVPIVMREVCLGVSCAEGETCNDLGECVSAQIVSEQCENGVCGEVLLPEPSGQSPGTLGAEVQLTSGAGQHVEPSLVWNDQDFALAWTNDNDGNQQIHFMRFDASGGEVVADVSDLAIQGGSKVPVLSPAGAGFAVAFDSNGAASYVRSLTPDGLQGGPFNLNIPNATSPTLASIDSIVAVAAIHQTNGLEAHLLLSGQEGDPIYVSNTAGSPERPMLSATSTGFGLAWQESPASGNPQIFVALVDTAGTASAPMQVTTDSGSSTQPSIAASFTGFGLAWVDDRDGNEEIYFATLDATGARSGPVTRVTDAAGRSSQPALVWTGTDFGLAWSDERGDESQIYFTRLDEEGHRTDELPITTGPFQAREPTLAWTDAQFGLVWSDRRNDSNDLYFATITPLATPSPTPQ